MRHCETVPTAKQSRFCGDCRVAPRLAPRNDNQKNTGYAGVNAYLLTLPLNCSPQAREDTVECAIYKTLYTIRVNLTIPKYSTILSAIMAMPDSDHHTSEADLIGVRCKQCERPVAVFPRGNSMRVTILLSNHLEETGHPIGDLFTAPPVDMEFFPGRHPNTVVYTYHG